MVWNSAGRLEHSNLPLGPPLPATRYLFSIPRRAERRFRQSLGKQGRTANINSRQRKITNSLPLAQK
jgi:hypothetical protein